MSEPPTDVTIIFVRRTDRQDKIIWQVLKVNGHQDSYQDPILRAGVANLGLYGLKVGERKNGRVRAFPSLPCS